MTPPAREGDTLTERELAVLRGLVDGQANGAIARRMLVSEDTVKTNARRLYSKLGARDRANAVALGFARRVLEADPDTFEIRVISDRPAARLRMASGGRPDIPVGARSVRAPMSPAVEHVTGLAAQQTPVGAP